MNFRACIQILVCTLALGATPQSYAQETTSPTFTPTGIVAVRAVQGTPGGPEILGSVNVELLLVHNSAVLDTRNATLDEHGIILFENLPVAMGVTPVVRINYDGVVYQTIGEPMDAQQSQQSIDVVCYELTEMPPDWDIHIRHVMINHGPGGVHITEILVMRNPNSQTWVGKRDDTGKGDTVSFTIPSGAHDVELKSGFHGWCCTRHEGGRIINTLPLMPGGAEFSLSYFVPTLNGEVTLHLESPTDVSNLTIIVPADVLVTNDDDFVFGGETRIADTNVRFYEQSEIAANTPVHVALSGLQDTPSLALASSAPIASPAATGEPTSRRASRGPLLLVGTGGIVAVLAFVALLLWTKRSGVQAATP